LTLSVAESLSCSNATYVQRAAKYLFMEDFVAEAAAAD